MENLGLSFEQADACSGRMNVLQIPIRDKYFQQAMHPHRNPEFATSKGYQFSTPVEETSNENSSAH